MHKARVLLDKFIRDRHGNVVLWQRPNLPLAVWAIARVAEWPAHGQLKHALDLVATAALLLWALLELVQGASYARRLLGLVVLSLTLFSLTR